MSASTSFPLRYVLPTTALTLHATLRLAVVVDPQGGHLEPEVAASLSASWHPTPLTSSRRMMPVEASPLRGSLPAYAVPGSLRKTFDHSHPRTAALIADLSARAEQYLAGLRMGEGSEQVVTFGQALEIVHRELATADRLRREWVSRQGRDVRCAEWDLTAGDVVNLDAATDTLPADTQIPDGRAQEMASEFGLLVAIWSDRGEGSGPSRGAAGVGVYRRLPDSLPEHSTRDGERVWVRDESLSRLRLADAGESSPEIPQQRVPAHNQPSLTVADYPLWTNAALEAAVRAARTQLELLDSSDEYSRLASTQYRDAEIAALQHEMRLAHMPRQRQGD